MPYKKAVLWQLELPLLYLTECTAGRNGNLGDVRQFSGRYLKSMSSGKLCARRRCCVEIRTVESVSNILGSNGCECHIMAVWILKTFRRQYQHFGGNSTSVIRDNVSVESGGSSFVHFSACLRVYDLSWTCRFHWPFWNWSFFVIPGSDLPFFCHVVCYFQSLQKKP